MVYLFFTAFLISFLGQLPLGNMSFTATQIHLQESMRKAWQYAAGVAIVEMLYLRVALTGMDWIVQHRILFKTIGWVTMVLFLFLGCLSFISARNQQPEKKAALLNNTMHRFLLGLTMSALNPVQIPFWFLWTSTLVQTKVLAVSQHTFNVFTIGAGMGTLGGLALYIHGGNWLVTKMKTSNKTLNQVMGIIFLLTALLQLYRMLWSPWI